MGKVMILNASPRAIKSNSKLYAEIFSKFCQSDYFNLSKKNHLELCAKFEEFHDILLVFPLYVDSLPVTLLHFLKTLESYFLKNRPTISVLINCGFLEPHQNDIAIQMIQLFCKKNDFPFGSVLKIGSGEAILNTPFRFLVMIQIKKLAHAILSQKPQTLQITMPLSKKLFIKASTKYWIAYGEQFNTSKEQMESMQIE